MWILLAYLLACDPAGPAGHIKGDTPGTEGGGLGDSVTVQISWPEDGAALPLGQEQELRGEVAGLSGEEGWLCYWQASPGGEPVLAVIDASGQCTSPWTATEERDYLLSLNLGQATGPEPSSPSAQVTVVGDPVPQLALELDNASGDWEVMEGEDVKLLLRATDNGGSAALVAALNDELTGDLLVLELEEEDGSSATWSVWLVDVEAGRHHLEATVTDGVGGVGYLEATLMVGSEEDNDAPALELEALSAAAGERVEGVPEVLEGDLVELTFTASDPDPSEDAVDVQFYWELQDVEWSELLEVCGLSPTLPEESWETDPETLSDLGIHCSQRVDLDSPTVSCTFETPAIDDTTELSCLEGDGDALMVEESWRQYRIWAQATDSYGASSAPMEIELLVYDSESLDEDEDGYSIDDGDCDDEDEGRRPGAADRCEAATTMAGQIDDDCDGEINEDEADFMDVAGQGETEATAIVLGDGFEARDTYPTVGISANLHWGETTTGAGDVDWYRVDFAEDEPADARARFSSALQLVLSVEGEDADVGGVLDIEVFQGLSLSSLEPAYPLTTTEVDGTPYSRTLTFTPDDDSSDLIWLIKVTSGSNWVSSHCSSHYHLSIECTEC